ncbi:MAG: flavodoxin domain-containing protein [Pseudodonghicola sp.]
MQRLSEAGQGAPRRILICYASTEGQTRKICRFAAEQLIAKGLSVEMLPAGDAAEVALAAFDAAILAGSVHLGRLQPELAEFCSEHAGTLNRMPTLLLVVSLAAAGNDPDERAALDRIAAAFASASGWRPGRVEHVAGAFRFGAYGPLRRWAMRWIAWRKGQRIAPGQDREYTDWAALAALLKGWPA